MNIVSRESNSTKKFKNIKQQSSAEMNNYCFNHAAQNVARYLPCVEHVKYDLRAFVDGSNNYEQLSPRGNKTSRTTWYYSTEQNCAKYGLDRRRRSELGFWFRQRTTESFRSNQAIPPFIAGTPAVIYREKRSPRRRQTAIRRDWIRANRYCN